MLSWTIGDVRISAIVEMSHEFPCDMLLPEATVAEVQAIDWLKPPLIAADGKLILTVQAFVVDAPGRRIVVDTCMGNDKQRTSGGHMLKTDFLDRFEGAGFARESIDVVLCTHLHIDHVGWNTMLVDGRWVPTFPKARYLIGRTEHAYWRDNAEGDDAAVFADSVQPLFDHGQVDLIDSDHRISAEISLVPTPGHTPGHVSVLISSGGAAALISGDFLHSPAQIARPEWGAYVDSLPEEARASRRAMLERLASEPTLLIGTHFPAPTAGRVERDGAAFRFVA